MWLDMISPLSCFFTFARLETYNTYIIYYRYAVVEAVAAVLPGLPEFNYKRESGPKLLRWSYDVNGFRGFSINIIVLEIARFPRGHLHRRWVSDERTDRRRRGREVNTTKKENRGTNLRPADVRTPSSQFCICFAVK